jgi:uncharacterized membrane-anchored protein YitT (DUF2179 family)
MFQNIKKKKWFYLILNDIFLALSIYIFTLGMKLNTGGIDGLSILTFQIFQICFQLINNKDIIVSSLMIFYNLLSLIIGFKLFKKDFLIKTFILCIILNISIFFLVIILGNAENNIILKCFFPENLFIKLILSSIFSGLFIGLTLSNIRKIGYTTGGMDIFQKILKDYYKINFIIILFITDGFIIFFSSLLESIKNNNNYIFDFKNIFTELGLRIFCSLFSILIIGYIAEKNYNH